MFEDAYDDLDSIPENVRHLYKSGEDGRYVLIAAGEVKTVQDVLRVQEALRKEREDHKDSRSRLAGFSGLDPDEIHQKLDRIEELESLSAGKVDESKINELVDTRSKSKIAPLERQLKQYTDKIAELEGTISNYSQRERTQTIREEVRKHATASKMRPEAVEDAYLLADRCMEISEEGKPVTKDGVGVTPGVGVDVWLTDIKQTRSHWWPESQGVGARGGSGISMANNPFSKDSWNMTEQGRIHKEDPKKAEQLAKAAGATIGAGRPN